MDLRFFLRRHLSIVIVLNLLSISSASYNFDSCNLPLGMESRQIKDSSLLASSAYDSASVGPQHGRLRNDKNGGAWCPKAMVSREAREFLEIHLLDLYVITQTKTQGRYGNGQGQEYAEGYMLDYWRPGLLTWVRWKNRAGERLLTGNTNTFTIVDQNLNPAIIASKIRFIPYSDHVRTVCMRVELVGCKWKDGLSSYSMPQGYLKEAQDLRDKIYDGMEENGRLFAGLGQLVDGHLGPDAFPEDGAKGNEWVGWKNDTSVLAGLPVEILFQFNVVRNFSAVHLHTNNYFSKGVQVFSHAKAFFAIQADSFNGEPVQFSYMPDLILEHSRNVTIKLHNRLGRFVKLQLYFASRWILLSEVNFDSEPVVNNFTEEEFIPKILDTNKEYPLQRDRSEDITSPTPVTRKRTTIIEKTRLPSVDNHRKTKSDEYGYIGFVIGTLSVIITLLVGAIVFIVFKNYRIKLLTSVSCSSFPNVMDENLTQKKVILGETEKSSILQDALKTELQPKRCNAERESKSGVPDIIYCEPLQSQSDNQINKTLSPNLYLTFPKPPKHPPEISYSEGDFMYSVPFRKPSSSFSHNGSRNKRGVSSSFLEKNTASESSSNKFLSSNFLKITHNSLKFIEKIGEGAIVNIHICENKSSGVTSSKKFAVVHSLISKRYRDEFVRNFNLWNKFNHCNVACVIGACLDEDPIFMVKEYGIMGDLCQFLQDHVAETASPLVPTAKTLSYNCLIHMTTQVALGMQYLESVGFVHKDLAARNCLVGENFDIKISDLGAYKKIYNTDYCSIAGSRPLPIRWMSWEALLIGKFSSKSDVWSFAVTMWEILTFAREQPYEDMSDDDVIANITHLYQNDGNEIFLSPPINCPKDIFELMLECWHRNEFDRPSFREISLFLQRKNLGFLPDLH